MILRIFHACWFISLVVVTVVLLYAYASLPENVVVYSEDITIMKIARDTYFFLVLGMLAVINMMVFVIARIMVRKKRFRMWFSGLVITFNIFFIVGINFVALYNSGEVYSYQRLQAIIYTSIGLFSVWTVGWPFYIGYRRFLKRS